MNPGDKITSISGRERLKERPGLAVGPERRADVRRELGNPGFWRIAVPGGRRCEAGRGEQPGGLKRLPSTRVETGPLARRLPRGDLNRVAVLVGTLDQAVDPAEA